MSLEGIRVANENTALVITIDRAERRNALSMATMDSIRSVVSEAGDDGDVRTIIITGGPTFFSAGADLNEALEVKSATDGFAFFGCFHRLAETIERSGKPVIAAIEGFCMTGGCELAMACDLRVGARESSYAITSSRIGTVAGFGGTQRLPRLVGPANAMEILFSAEPITAEHAYRIGLINRLTDKGQAMTEALQMADTFAKRAPLGLAFAKRAVHQGMQMDLASAIEMETFMATTIYGTEDKQEGVAAFLEKRKPEFKGR